MGMYTELVLGVEIENNPDVISIIKYMLGESNVKPQLPEHSLFKTDRWKYMLHCDSYYFAGTTHSNLKCDTILGIRYFLTIRSNLKNYDSEIEKFLDWLCPYIKTYGFLGYKRYEEFEDPTLIYKEYDTIQYRSIYGMKIYD